MNEQIKEFWEQATQHADQVVVYTPHVDRVHPGYFDAKAWTEVLQGKFAELIVAECIASLRTEECNTSDLAVEEYTRNRKRIEQHFGVK